MNYTKMASLLFGVSLFVLTASIAVPAYAQATDISPTVLPLPTLTQVDNKQIDYTLPYPGLLPDSPLYFIKTFRDRVVSFFISDPLKKAEFDLLLSDKRVNASYYLFQYSKDKQEVLINTTLSKAVNYYDEGVGQLRQAKMQGENITDMARTYSTASMKYQELLKGMESQALGQMKKDFVNGENRVSASQKSLSSLTVK